MSSAVSSVQSCVYLSDGTITREGATWSDTDLPEAGDQRPAIEEAEDSAESVLWVELLRVRGHGAELATLEARDPSRDRSGCL